MQFALVLVAMMVGSGMAELDPCLYHFTEIQFNYEEGSSGAAPGGKAAGGAGTFKLQVGGHVKSANVKHVALDGTTSDSFDISLDDLNKEEGVKTTSDAEEFYRDIDVTKKVKENNWYLICVTSTIIAAGKPTTCNRCTLKKVCKNQETCTTRFANSTLVYRLTSRNQVVIAYFVQDLPGGSATLRSKVFFKPADRYCAPALYDEPIKVIETPVVANSIAYVTIEGLKAKEFYFVNTDATIKTKDGKSTELINYLSATNREEIKSCSALPNTSERSC